MAYGFNDDRSKLQAGQPGGLATLGSDGKVPLAQLPADRRIPVATTNKLGGVMVDGITIKISPAGVIRAEAGGGSGGEIVIDSAMSNTSENPVQNKVIKNALDRKLDNTVNIPEKTSELTNDSGFINRVGSGLRIDQNGVLQLDITSGDEVSY